MPLFPFSPSNDTITSPSKACKHRSTRVPSRWDVLNKIMITSATLARLKWQFTTEGCNFYTNRFLASHRLICCIESCRLRVDFKRWKLLAPAGKSVTLQSATSGWLLPSVELVRRNDFEQKIRPNVARLVDVNWHLHLPCWTRWLKKKKMFPWEANSCLSNWEEYQLSHLPFIRVVKELIWICSFVTLDFNEWCDSHCKLHQDEDGRNIKGC